jgi:DNA (cytosine-5)-methyltransferase 1
MRLYAAMLPPKDRGNCITGGIVVNKINQKPVAIDLFSGAGGLSEGFIMAGFHVIASVEKNKIAAETQRHNHTHWKKYRTKVINDDLRNTVEVIDKLHAEGIEAVDVIVGGPPCRGFSRANMRTRNRDNSDNELFHQFVSIVTAYKPRIIVIENVADLAVFANGEVVDDIMALFRCIGYRADMAVLNAVNFGVPQKRKRIFFIGTCYKTHIEFPDPEITDPARFVSVWDAISDLPPLANGNTIDEMPYRSDVNLTDYQRKMRKGGNALVRNNLVTRNNDLVIKRYTFIPQGGNWRDIPDELMSNYTNKERCHQRIYHRLPENKPAATITNFRKSMLIHPRENRGLSVREAARLQSFRDSFIFYGSILHQQQQVANAVPPLLARAVAKSVRRMLKV